MKNLIYLDYAATTPVADEVIERMLDFMSFKSKFANPASRNHGFGLKAHWAVEDARAQLANVIGAEAQEIIWTSGATESNNLALKGLTQQYATEQRRHIITSQIEHKAILDSCAELEQQGFEVTYLAPEAETGLITAEILAAALRPDTLLVSLMMVNNEIGTVTDVAALAQMVKANGSYFHVDAAQAVGKLAIDLNTIRADMMSFSAHKAYGPKGVGALYVRQSSGLKLKAQMHGGGHELGMRSGTLATHQIVGMAEAFALANQKREFEQNRIRTLQTQLWNGLSEQCDVKLNGDLNQSVANYLNVSFIGENASDLIRNIQSVAAVSQGSACNSQQAKPSHVLQALGRHATAAAQSIRFSFGAYSTAQDVQTVLDAVQIEKRAFLTF